MDIRPPTRPPRVLAVQNPVDPRTPDERFGERDYFTRRITLPAISLDPAVISPNTLERIAPSVQPMTVEAPVRAPRFFGRRIPLPSRLSYLLAAMTGLAFVAGFSTLGIAISNRLARLRDGEDA